MAIYQFPYRGQAQDFARDKRAQGYRVTVKEVGKAKRQYTGLFHVYVYRK